MPSALSKPNPVLSEAKMNVSPCFVTQCTSKDISRVLVGRRRRDIVRLGREGGGFMDWRQIRPLTPLPVIVGFVVVIRRRCRCRRCYSRPVTYSLCASRRVIT